MRFDVMRVAYQITELLIMLATLLLVDKTCSSFYVESDSMTLTLDSPVVISSEDADQWEKAKDVGNPLILLWTFETNSSQRIMFTFQSFHFPHACKMDIGDGPYMDADRAIVNFSDINNANLPSTETSPTNYAWMQVTLKSLFEMDKPSLNITVQAVETQALILKERMEVPIKSPHYPELYPNNDYRLWDIKTEDNSPIKVEVLVFNVEKDKDYLHIGDGVVGFTKSGDTWRHWTGNMEDSRQNLTFISESSHLQMIFTSDWAKARVGFNILLRAVDTTTTQPSVTSGIHSVTAGISNTRRNSPSQVFQTTVGTTSTQLLNKQGTFFTWLLTALASLLAFILMVILLRWLHKKYLKRWIARHMNSGQYYIVSPNSTEHSVSLMDDNLYEEILDDPDKSGMKRNNSPYNTIKRASLPLTEICRQSTAKVQVHPTGISVSQRLPEASLATASICGDKIEVNGQECVNDDMQPAEVETEFTVRDSIEAKMVVGMPDHQSNTNSLSPRAASQVSMHSTVKEDTNLSGLKEVDEISKIHFKPTTSADDVLGSTSDEAVENREDSLDETESYSLWNVSDYSSEEEDLNHTNLYDMPRRFEEQEEESLDRSSSPIPAHTHDPISTPLDSTKEVLGDPLDSTDTKTPSQSPISQIDTCVKSDVCNCPSAVTDDTGCDKPTAGNTSVSLNVNTASMENSAEPGGVLLEEVGYLIIEDDDHETNAVESQPVAIRKNLRYSPSIGNPEKTQIDKEKDVNIDEFGYLILEDVSRALENITI